MIILLLWHKSPPKELMAHILISILRVTLIQANGNEVTASRIVENLGYTVSEDGKTYTVYNADGLIEWANAVNAEKGQYRYTNCILTADINMQDKTWAGVCTGNSECSTVVDILSAT